MGNNMQNEIDRLKADYAELEHEYDSLGESLEGCLEMEKRKRDEIKNLKSKLENGESLWKDLRDENLALTYENAALKKEKAFFIACKSVADERKSHKCGGSCSCADKDAEIAKLKAENEKLKAGKTEMEEAWKNKRDEVWMLKGQMEKLKSEKDSLSYELARIRHGIYRMSIELYYPTWGLGWLSPKVHRDILKASEKLHELSGIR